MVKTFSYENNGVSYPVIIEHKSMYQRSIRFRFRDGKFYVSAPYVVSNKHVLSLIESKYGPYFLSHQKPASKGDDFIYIFGEKLPFKESGVIKFSNDKIIKYKDFEQFEKKMKKLFLEIVTERVRYYEKLMNLTPHNVRVRKMTSRYGSNSKKTKTVCFALSLYHYSYEILDSIIVHELAHSVYFNHSDKFYKVVYQFCPNYKALHTKLRKGEFK